jgi:hypothetical protein
MFQECRHIMPSGSRCRAAALRKMPYCYFHATLHRLANPKNRPANEPLHIPVLEDAGAIQIALSQIVDALGSSRIDPRRAALLLSAIRVAVSLIPRPSADHPARPVRAFSCEDDGEVLAPEQSVCEPFADCRKCEAKDSCISMKRINMRSIRRILTSYAKGQAKWNDEELESGEQEGQEAGEQEGHEDH